MAKKSNKKMSAAKATRRKPATVVAKKTKGASKSTRHKSTPEAVGATAEHDVAALLRERWESASRTTPLISAREAQTLHMIAGSERSAVRVELAPLHAALGMVSIRCNALALSIAERANLPTELGSALAHSILNLPASPSRLQWEEQWAIEYGLWWDAIKAARLLAGEPAVAAIMDAGEQRPAKKWTSRTAADLDRLAATLHPTREGGSGLGFIRAGAESLPTNFAALADSIAARAVELQSVPQSSSAAPKGVVQTESASTDDAMPPALDGSDCIVLHALKKLGQERLHSADRIARWLTDHKRAKQRSSRTVSSSLKNLVRLGYAERPNGERRGARLTMKGLRAEDCCD